MSEFDQGLYGGLLGGEVRFLAHPDMGWISSMVPPLLKDWSEFDRLRFDPSHPWWERYLRQMDIFIRRGAGKWGISHFILIDALNFVFELIGATETYLSVEDRPEMIRRAIDFGHDLNCKVQQEFFDRVGLFNGGTLSNFSQWIPGRIVSKSLDPYHMTSVDYFERWGREPTERMLASFDGGIVHIHGNGRHLLEAAAIDTDDDYVTDYSYDNLGRVTSIQQQDQGDNAVAEKRIDFTYDAAGQYATIEYYKDTDGGSGNLVMTATYTLDDAGRLTDLDYTDATPAMVRDFEWFYDEASRITGHDSDIATEDVAEDEYVYDDTNQWH